MMAEQRVFAWGQGQGGSSAVILDEAIDAHLVVVVAQGPGPGPARGLHSEPRASQCANMKGFIDLQGVRQSPGVDVTRHE